MTVSMSCGWLTQSYNSTIDAQMRTHHRSAGHVPKWVVLLGISNHERTNLGPKVVMPNGESLSIPSHSE